MTDDIFVRMARGDVEAHTVLTTEHVMAVLDIAPASSGHTIIFPKEQYQVLAQLPDGIRTSLFEATRIVRHGLARSDPSITGVTSVLHQGPAAGQRAPHVLIHTIPRRAEDGLFPLSGYDGPDPDAFERIRTLASDDPAISISLPEARRTAAEVMLIDASVDLFEELEGARLASFAERLTLVSKAVFEVFEAEGTTILIESGTSQHVLGAEARIIPRWHDDGLALDWEPHDASDLRAVRDAVAHAIADLARPSQPVASQPSAERTPDNYLLKQLKRIP